MEVNVRVMNTLFCAPCPEEFNWVCTCKIAKEIWDKLETTHKSTKHVKEMKINLLIHDYELFSMKENKSMKEMFTRFNDIVTDLESLGKAYTNGEKVRKIWRSLPRVWDSKVTTEVKYLDDLSFDNLLGSLMIYEIMMKRDDVDDTKKMRGVAFKVEKESQDSDDDDFVMLAT